MPSELPKELVVLYLLGPLVASPILDPDLFSLDRIGILRSILANYVPFLALPAGIHALYHWFIPRLKVSNQAIWNQLLVHGGLNTLLALIVGSLVWPVHNWVGNCISPYPRWISVCTVLTWSFVLPGVVIQKLRFRAEQVERRALEQRQEALKSQLEAIQSRTNPHFLFNSMNTIAALIRDDPDLAEDTLERLAELLRYALQSSQKEAVPLSQEIDMLRDYLEVQKARFGERLNYLFEIDSGLEELSLPPLLLQHLVEKAVVHGISQSYQGGQIHVSIQKEGGQIKVKVENPLAAAKVSMYQGTGTGLRDLLKRMKLLYGEEGQLKTQTSEQGNFVAELSFPEGTIS